MVAKKKMSWCNFDSRRSLPMAEFLTIFRKLVFLSKGISCEAAKHGEVNSSVYGSKSTGAGELVISLSIRGIYLYI